jgi:hypothetical protein
MAKDIYGMSVLELMRSLVLLNFSATGWPENVPAGNFLKGF